MKPPRPPFDKPLEVLQKNKLVALDAAAGDVDETFESALDELAGEAPAARRG